MSLRSNGAFIDASLTAAHSAVTTPSQLLY